MELEMRVWTSTLIELLEGLNFAILMTKIASGGFGQSQRCTVVSFSLPCVGARAFVVKVSPVKNQLEFW